MTPKVTSHVIQGMQKDTSKSKLSKEFAFDAKNIRITAREDNSLLSVTNEKGNKFEKSFLGNYVGHCVINNQLVLFTTTGNTDFIFLYDSDLRPMPLYSGNLNFSVDNPLETLGVYENEDIQKVYWVDGRNQPRVINIKDDKTKFNDNYFNFVLNIELEDELEVIAESSNNSNFHSGIIQYAFTYHNKYLQESNIVNTSDLCYIRHKDRGGTPEEIINDIAFKIDLKNLDINFDYVKVYSIFRSSLDSYPVVKMLGNYPIVKNINKEEEYKEEVLNYINVDIDYSIAIVENDIVKYSNNIENVSNSIINNLEGITKNTVETGIFKTTTYTIDLNKLGDNYKLTILPKNANLINPTISLWKIDNLITPLDGAIVEYTVTTISSGNLNIEKEKKINVLNNKNIHYKTEYKYKYNYLSYVSLIDNGSIGEDVDPSLLLYIGGEDIIAGTITQKDNTLFLGNLKLSKKPILRDELVNEHTSIMNYVISINDSSRSMAIEDPNINTENYYNLHFQDRAINTNTFKSGEHYRLGVQFQYKNGKWSEPLYITDYTVNDFNRPQSLDGIYSIPKIEAILSKELIDKVIELGYKRVRGIIVNPTIKDRKIIAQGMLCPTVYRYTDREKGSPYAQSSWFIRPFLHKNITDDDYSDGLGPSSIEFRHYHPTAFGDGGQEIESYYSSLIIKEGTNGKIFYQNKDKSFCIDQSMLTFHSPDLEFSNITESIFDSPDIKLRIVGLINWTSNFSDLKVQVSRTSDTSFPGLGEMLNIKEGVNIPNNSIYGDKRLCSGFFYNIRYMGGWGIPMSYDNYFNLYIYPWQSGGSMSGSIADDENPIPDFSLLTKKISNLKFSSFNYWLSEKEIWDAENGSQAYRNRSYENGISSIGLFNSDQISLLKIKDSDEILYNYYGNVDLAITDTYTARAAEIIEYTYTPDFQGDKEDNKFIRLEGAQNKVNPILMKYKSTPHCVLKLNKSSNGCLTILPTINDYNKNNIYIPKPDVFIPEGEEITYVGKEDPKYTNTTIEYLSTWLVLPPDENGVYTLMEYGKGSNTWTEKVFTYQENGYYFYTKKVLPTHTTYQYYKVQYVGYAYKLKKDKTVTVDVSELGSSTNIYQGIMYLNIEEDYKYPFLYLAELYRDTDNMVNSFGGKTRYAIESNLWIPSGPSKSLNNIEEDGTIKIEYLHGDTWYQRYDCLKTYAFTPEDENQVIEVASFMCESRVNLDGRYDKNIGNLSNLNADPTNFNLFNPIYSQKDNFFNYRILDSDLYKLDKFDTTITWSKEKFAGSMVDTWTNITMASTLDLDGTKGKVNKLITAGEGILCFQDKGFSQILFNNRVQIPVSDGVPVEITNGYKVDGYRYISDIVGCQNKNSIINTPSGVYFLDGESNGIYNYGGGLINLSTQKGFDMWTKEIANDPTFKTFYDKNNKDVYFTTKDYCLCFSEKLNQFTSFYDYNNVETMFNIETDFYSIKGTKLYKHFAGEYNTFYEEVKPYHITLITNEDSYVDKVFTNIEYRADVFTSDNTYLENKSFDTLEAWNEYQSGKSILKFDKYRPSTLKKKFRMWRADIPRDSVKKMDRMRNPWLFIKLSNNNPGTDKMELHDIVVHFFE